MAQNLVKFSTSNLPVNTRVDVDSLSERASRYTDTIPAPLATQNAVTEYAIAIPTTYAVKVVAVSLVYPGVVPAASGGTSTLKIEHIASDGSTAVEIVAAVSILSGLTTQIPLALTIATTNPTSMAAGGSIMATVTTSNHTVGAAGVNGTLTFLLEPVDPATLSE